jgi:MFS family permease
MRRGDARRGAHGGDETVDAIPAELRRRSLAASHREAAVSAVMTGVTEPFMAPYVLALGGTSLQAGLLSSVRNLVLSLIQLASAPAIRVAGSRKTLVLWTAAVQAVLWFPIAIVGIAFGRDAVPILIVLYTTGTAISVLGGPAWGSLVASYLHAHERGRFFGRRARIVGVWTSIASFLAGGVLQITQHRPLLGFACLSAAAGICRVVSCAQLAQLHDPPWSEHPHLESSFFRFLAHVGHNNYSRFGVSLAALNFAAHLSAPYFAIFMLEELHYDYLTYTGVVLAGSLTGTLAGPWWGRIGDTHGNQAVLRWTMLGVGILPALWPLFPHPLWMMSLNAAGAFLWAGLNLSSVNFIYDAAGAHERHTWIAYFNVLNGLGVSAGALVGGVAIDLLPPLGGSRFAAVFVLSAALRFVVAFAFRALVREVRPVRQIGLREVMYDVVGQRVVQVLGLFTALLDEEERSRRSR